jgi:serine/threonine protein kinase
VKSLPANSDSVSSIPCPSNGPASGLSTKPITELPEGRRIEEMEYVDAVLWLGSQIASGLTHAHDRGILHRDLKPANILLTDENVPMILDFNLSEDVKSRHASLIARIGGTLPYMSPEQLEIFRGGDRNLDARSDLYSLGLILFQLLTGHHPYRLPKGNLSDVVDTMLADRRKEPPLLTPFNRTISPAVESIVRHCLFANPGDRYASARALREDIELHREHRPLKYAPNPSGMERFWKWTRRNPWVKSPLTLSLVCSVGLFSGATALHSHRDQVRTNEVREMTMHSQQLFQSVTEQINQGRMLMLDWAASPEKLRQGSELLNRAVEKYDAGQNPDWHQERGVQILPEADQTKLREQIEESKQLLSRVRELMNPNTPAMQNLLQQSAPTQIQNLLNTSPAKSSTSVPEVDAATRRQLITDFTSHGRYADAIPYLKQSLKANESDHESWFQLGCCLRMTGDAREAIHAFTATLASKPKWVEALWNRAQLHGSLNDHRSALIDLDSILKLQPDHHEAIIERAVVLCRLQKPQEALTVLAPLMEDAQAPTRVWFIRADIKALLKDQTGAEADRKHGLSLEPNEVQSWNARGFLRMKTDVKGALADLEEAEKLDPRSIHALQNQAHLYGEVLKQPEKALAALDRLLKHHPQYLPAVANRGLYLARLGQVENAVNQAQAALALSQDAYTQFRAACIYARASAMQANFKKDALTHLAKALMNGYGYDLLVNNPDLESLKGDLFFNQLKGFAVLMKSMQK